MEDGDYEGIHLIPSPSKVMGEGATEYETLRCTGMAGALERARARSKQEHSFARINLEGVNYETAEARGVARGYELIREKEDRWAWLQMQYELRYNANPLHESPGMDRAARGALLGQHRHGGL